MTKSSKDDKILEHIKIICTTYPEFHEIPDIITRFFLYAPTRVYKIVSKSLKHQLHIKQSVKFQFTDQI